MVKYLDKANQFVLFQSVFSDENRSGSERKPITRGADQLKDDSLTGDKFAIPLQASIGQLTGPGQTKRTFSFKGNLEHRHENLFLLFKIFVGSICGEQG